MDSRQPYDGEVLPLEPEAPAQGGMVPYSGEILPLEAAQPSMQPYAGEVLPLADAPPARRVIDPSGVRMGQDRFSKIERAAAEGFGPERVGVSEKSEARAREIGLFPPEPGQGSALQVLNEGVIRPAAVVGDAFLRGMNALNFGVAEAAGQVAETVGAEKSTADRLRRDTNLAMQVAPFAAMGAPVAPGMPEPPPVPRTPARGAPPGQGGVPAVVEPVRAAAEPPEVLPRPAVGDGTARAPAVIETAADLDAATRRVTADPIPAQIEAGNYAKGHVQVQGLDIAIETPKGGMRRGTAPDGTPWETRAPAAYGYVKRTRGGDGEAVDVYVGDRPDSRMVYVVDQIDPVTGKFDEHKAVLGTADEAQAVDIYDRGFSDGSGPQRRGAVTPMSVDEFKTWLGEGATDRALGTVVSPGTLDRAQAAMRQFLDRAGLQDVAINVERLIHSSWGERVDGTSTGGLIRVAMDQPARVEATLVHEAVHEARRLGLFTPEENRALDNMANVWRRRFKIDERYGELHDPATAEGRRWLREEAVAHAAAEYFGKAGQTRGLARKLFDRLKSMLDGVRDGFTQADLRSAEDVFKAFRAGEMQGRRGLPAPREAGRTALAKPAEPILIPYRGPVIEEGPMPRTHLEEALAVERRPRDTPYMSMPKGARRQGLTEWVRDRGGISTSDPLIGDVRGIVSARDWRIANRDGMPIDRMREAAAEAGYLDMDSTPRDFLDLLARDYKARTGQYAEQRVYPERGNYELTEQRLEVEAQNRAVDEAAHLFGIDPAGLTAEKFWRIVEEHVSIEERARAEPILERYNEADWDAWIEEYGAPRSREAFEREWSELAAAEDRGPGAGRAAARSQDVAGEARAAAEDFGPRPPAGEAGRDAVTLHSLRDPQAMPEPLRRALYRYGRNSPEFKTAEAEWIAASDDLARTVEDAPARIHDPATDPWSSPSTLARQLAAETEAGVAPQHIYSPDFYRHVAERQATVGNENQPGRAAPTLYSFRDRASAERAKRQEEQTTPYAHSVLRSTDVDGNPVWRVSSKGELLSDLMRRTGEDFAEIEKRARLEGDMLRRAKAAADERQIGKAFTPGMSAPEPAPKPAPPPAPERKGLTSEKERAEVAMRGKARAKVEQQSDAGPLFQQQKELFARRQAMIRETLAERGRRLVSTPAFQNWFGASKIVDQGGAPKMLYRGDFRDIGPKLHKGKSESASGFYFTDNPEVASGYATGKHYVAEHSGYEDYFKFKVPGERSPRNLDNVWRTLPDEQRRAFQDVALRANLDDANRLSFDGPADGGIAGIDTWKHYLQEARGNWLKAAKEIWLNGGVLFDRESMFSDILRRAGIRNFEFDDPRQAQPTVTPVYARIERPLVVGEIDQALIDRLRQETKGLRGRQQRSFGRDARGQSPREWVDMLQDDFTRSGGNLASEMTFTSVPDGVVKALQRMGYDGILDRGGKAGGPAGLIDEGRANHDVWIAFEPNQIKSVFNRGTFGRDTDKLLYSKRDPIRAYHGSPHDFDRFSMEKIGTGEGAQAFGRGLYFAENEGVARDYRDNVKDMATIDRANKRMSEIAREMEKLRKPGSMREFKEPRGYELADEYDRLMAEKMKPGRMYEVAINADPEMMLDWDLPLSQQSEGVQRALAWAGNDTGEQIVRKLGIASKDKAAAARHLRDLGIQGIRYLDQGSRRPGFSSLSPAELDARIETLKQDIDSGKGNQAKMKDQLAALERERDSYRNLTHNFVVFDDSLIEIIRKYGLAALGLGTALAAAAPGRSDAKSLAKPALKPQ